MIKFGEAPDFSTPPDPADTVEPAPATPATAEDFLKVLDALASAEKQLALKAADLEKRLLEEPMRPTFTKKSIYDEFVQFVRAEFNRIHNLRLLLEEHRPPKEAETECKQCSKMIPLSLLRAHNQWHLALSLEAAEER